MKIIDPTKPKGVRVAGIILRDNKILLMKCKTTDKEYYICPGGRLEEDESLEEAVKRELEEECSLDVEVVQKLYHLEVKEASDHFVYLCKAKTFEAKISDFEMTNLSENFNHVPLWIDIDKINDLLIYPIEISELILSDIKSNFSECPRELVTFFKNLKQ
jgi:ADP-ribose pyrophosphatase YjhB (NUDIX family)